MNNPDFNGMEEPCKSCEFNRGFAGCTRRRCVLEDIPKEPRRYPQAVVNKVQATIPPEIEDVMHKKGWNAFGLYELVREALESHAGEDTKADNIGLNLAKVGLEAQRIHEAIQRFALDMTAKMISKIAKRGGWDDPVAFPMDRRLERLLDEMEEFSNALKEGGRAHVREECVDVANQIMMIWFIMEHQDLPEGWNDCV